MKTIHVFVSTLEGKTTQREMPYVGRWSSEEDQQYFTKIRDESPLTVIRTGTYDADPIKPTPTHPLIIMMRNPAKYKDNEFIGQFEFISESPTQLEAYYENAGLMQMLVVGGSHLAIIFLKVQLIDELWLTIEPKIFGIGSNLVINEDLEINLQLISLEKENERGTLMTKYAV